MAGDQRAGLEQKHEQEGPEDTALKIVCSGSVWARIAARLSPQVGVKLAQLPRLEQGSLRGVSE